MRQNFFSFLCFFFSFLFLFFYNFYIYFIRRCLYIYIYIYTYAYTCLYTSFFILSFSFFLFLSGKCWRHWNRRWISSRVYSSILWRWRENIWISWLVCKSMFEKMEREEREMRCVFFNAWFQFFFFYFYFFKYIFKIQLYFDASSMYPYFHVSYSDKVSVCLGVYVIIIHIFIYLIFFFLISKHNNNE